MNAARTRETLKFQLGGARYTTDRKAGWVTYTWSRRKVRVQASLFESLDLKAIASMAKQVEGILQTGKDAVVEHHSPHFLVRPAREGELG